ncbi:kinase to dihydroxyacetone kinase [Dellaglioa algida]|uniref:Fatty acid kinase subunit A-like middle domain-containing protein n=1 Tax=Dellaglioa algida TaxID=105612 RepID=A0A5C6MBS3_9LACO|nr:kinase to dihydroxyacetone kinase [Dellaglioa algida]MDK1716948.1 kinase to dihydroxyacetone kinase [Dellaglioa algida]MDK1719722.1 kinase to dihydroxyacetone kinase [Dellaglioa algida]MDK1721817.1 kinase to dihydroxyacetone kinase [Dellaglioa algida]MDK1723065.1 kinase to dihydroxyacetone kinase [Dellaglioa algida]MDK1724684.1 kinase to dihydroxyacetone kinase [Dellaglioa algida]
MIEFKYDVQLLLEGSTLDEDRLYDEIVRQFEGDSLMVAGDTDLMKLHFHTNYPWKILEYCASLGDVFDIVVEDMVRQAKGLKG